MAILIPFQPSQNNYDLVVPIDGVNYVFKARWNAADNNKAGAWYFDLFDESDSPILTSVKITLGARFGRSSTHPFFQTHVLRAFDSSGEGREAAFDDLGRRVQVICVSAAEAFTP